MTLVSLEGRRGEGAPPHGLPRPLWGLAMTHHTDARHSEPGRGPGVGIRNIIGRGADAMPPRGKVHTKPKDARGTLRRMVKSEAKRA